MMSEDMEKLARQGLEDFNRSDWEAMRRTMAPDYVYEETGTGARADGAEALIEMCKTWKGATSDLAGELTRIVVDGDTVAMEIRWRGTHDGPMPLPSGELPATGRSMEMWATMWQTYRDGLLVHERHHMDMLTMLGQLGVLSS
jgi:steroid delta-isomerase-like uncharacterized protein